MMAWWNLIWINYTRDLIEGNKSITYMYVYMYVKV